VCAGHIAKQMGLPIHKLIVATNENDVLDEFFRTGAYRPRPETQHTSSPSMDISKASNFERFVYDLVGRDPAVVKDLWQKVDGGGSFDLSTTPHFAKVKEFGFTSGESTHANRLETIRNMYQKYGVMIDTHTADGVKVGLEHREAGIPLVCLETALPAKFDETIHEALGRHAERPVDLADLEKRPQRYEVMDSSADAVKRFIVAHCA
jgi:threonine synthase